MQRAGVVEQTYAAPTATPQILTMVDGEIPVGNSTGLLSQFASLFYDGAAKLLKLTGSNIFGAATLMLDAAVAAGNSVVQTDWATAGVAKISQYVFNTVGVVVSQFNVMQSGNAIDGFIWADSGFNAAGSILPNRKDAGFGSFNVNTPGATKGFLYVPTVSGDPTGTPDSLGSFINMVPVQVKSVAGAEAWEAYVNGAWRSAPLTGGVTPTPTRRASIYEEFMPSFNGGELRLTPFALGGLVQLIPSEAGHPGIMQMTSTTGGAIADLLADSTSWANVGGGTVEVRIGFRIPVLPTNADQFTTYLGLNSGVPDSAESIELRYVNNVNGGKIQYVCRAGGVETAVDSGLTPIANTWYYALIAINAAGTVVTFTINGANSQTINTNVPTNPLGGALGTTHNNGNGGTCHVDFYSFEQFLTTARQ